MAHFVTLPGGSKEQYVNTYRWNNERQAELPPIPEGFCQCGCGQRTNINQRTGEPSGYIAGHNLRLDDRRYVPDEEEDRALVEEFDLMACSVIWRWAKNWVNNPPYGFTLTFDDLKQEALLHLLRRKDELREITERDDRGLFAWKVMSTAVKKAIDRVTKRSPNKLGYEYVPILDGSEIGDGTGDSSTLDFGDWTESDAGLVEWLEALRAICPPEIVRAFYLVSQGVTLHKIGEKMYPNQRPDVASSTLSRRLDYYRAKIAKAGLTPED